MVEFKDSVVFVIHRPCVCLDEACDFRSIGKRELQFHERIHNANREGNGSQFPGASNFVFRDHRDSELLAKHLDSHSELCAASRTVGSISPRRGSQSRPVKSGEFAAEEDEMKTTGFRAQHGSQAEKRDLSNLDNVLSQGVTNLKTIFQTAALQNIANVTKVYGPIDLRGLLQAEDLRTDLKFQTTMKTKMLQTMLQALPSEILEIVDFAALEQLCRTLKFAPNQGMTQP